ECVRYKNFKHIPIIEINEQRFIFTHWRTISITNRVKTRRQPLNSLINNSSVVGQLLEESDLTARGNDCHLIVLTQFIFHKMRKPLSSSGEARRVEVEIIQVEKDGPTAIEWHRSIRKHWPCCD